MLGGDNVSIVSAGLPNIRGSFGGNQDISETGAFYRISTNNMNSGDYPYSANIGFDASLSNDIYGNSDTVQPPSFSMIPQIKF